MALAELERARRRPGRSCARSPRTPTSSASRATRRWRRRCTPSTSCRGFVARLRLRAARGHPRADAQVGQEEAQAAELRRGGQPRRGPRAAPRSSASTSTSTSRFVIAALEERADELGLARARRRERRLSAPVTAAQRYAARPARAARRARCSAPRVLARMPIGIDGLAIVLFVRAETRLVRARRRGGGAPSALGVGCSAPGPGPAHRPPRRSARVLLPLAVVHAVALVALVALGLGGRADGACWSPAALVGRRRASRRSASVVRPLLAGLLARRRRTCCPTAFALDAVAHRARLRRRPAAHRARSSPLASPALALLVAVGARWSSARVAFVASPAVARAGGRTRATASATAARRAALARACARIVAATAAASASASARSRSTLPGLRRATTAQRARGRARCIAVWSLGQRRRRPRLRRARARLGAAARATCALRRAPAAALAAARAGAVDLRSMAPLALRRGRARSRRCWRAGNQLVGDVAPAGA